LAEIEIPEFTILEAVTLESSPGRANEDCYGSNEACIFVIDGASGLGDDQYMSGFGSDAAWFAQFACDYFSKNHTGDIALAKVVRELSLEARREFFAGSGAENSPFYAWPSASFAMVELSLGELVFSGLGDCTLYLQCDHGVVKEYSAMQGFHHFEQQRAAKHIARFGGLDVLPSYKSDAQTLADLRKIRSLQNTEESGVWTLGLVPQAADHLVRKTIPFGNSARGLLCSDGFADLVNLFNVYAADSLLAEAANHGLEPLLQQLRHLENEIDPRGLKFPRFKRSDDATALLFEVSLDG